MNTITTNAGIEEEGARWSAHHVPYPASEIEEEHSSEPFEIDAGSGLALDTIREEIDFHNNRGESAVYVAIGKSSEESSSMDALRWTLSHAVRDPSSTVVFLIHVFPETKFIPMPLGMIPASQVNPEQRENYMAQERSKRSDFLHKFLNLCSISKVKVDTILIESDAEAKAILDLIPILNIRKLLLGTTKSYLRRMRARRGSGTIEQILKDEPEFCEVKIICEGREIANPMAESPSPSPPPPRGDAARTAQAQNHVLVNNDSFTCCFKPKAAS